MDKKTALELLNQLIEAQKKSSLIKAIDEIKSYAELLKNGHKEDLKKNDEEMAKIDPNTRLPGVMLDKGNEFMQPVKPQHAAIIKCLMSKAEGAPATPAPKPPMPKIASPKPPKPQPSLQLNEEMEKGQKESFDNPNSHGYGDKGVHTGVPTKYTAGTDKAHATSKPGHQVRSGNIKGAINSHKQNLNDLQSMPKPNLPKSEEMQKDSNEMMIKDDTGSKPKNSPAVSKLINHLKGVHSPLKTDLAHDPKKMGVSTSGYALRADHKSQAKDVHQQNLHDLQSMPKPNLPKTEKAEKSKVEGDDMSSKSKTYIKDISAKPHEPQQNRPGQANKPHKE